MPENSMAPKSPRPNLASGKGKNPWMLATIILAVALIAVLVTTMKGNANFKPVSSQDAGKSLITFVNEIYGAQIGQSTLKSISEKNGMYQAVVTVNNAGKDVEQTVYITKDGQLFVPQALNITEVSTQFRAFQANQQPAAPTTGAPVVETVPADQAPTDVPVEGMEAR